MRYILHMMSNLKKNRREAIWIFAILPHVCYRYFCHIVCVKDRVGLKLLMDLSKQFLWQEENERKWWRRRKRYIKNNTSCSKSFFCCCCCWISYTSFVASKPHHFYTSFWILHRQIDGLIERGSILYPIWWCHCLFHFHHFLQSFSSPPHTRQIRKFYCFINKNDFV